MSSDQPQNRNFLSPTGFKFSLKRAPKVSFFCNSANIPDLKPKMETELPTSLDKLVINEPVSIPTPCTTQEKTFENMEPMISESPEPKKSNIELSVDTNSKIDLGTNLPLSETSISKVLNSPEINQKKLNFSDTNNVIDSTGHEEVVRAESPTLTTQPGNMTSDDDKLKIGSDIDIDTDMEIITLN